MGNLESYIKPELLVLTPVLYIIGLMIKETDLLKNKYIPLLLGAIGIVLSLLYVIANEGFSATGVFTSITQGIITAGIAVYVNELITQTKGD